MGLESLLFTDISTVKILSFIYATRQFITHLIVPAHRNLTNSLYRIVNKWNNKAYIIIQYWNSCCSFYCCICLFQVSTGALCIATHHDLACLCWKPNVATLRRQRQSVLWPLCLWPTPTPWITGTDPNCRNCGTNRAYSKSIHVRRLSARSEDVMSAFCSLGPRRSPWKRRNHCNRGNHEGVTLLPLTSPQNASLSCEESRLIPSFTPPPNPAHHVSHLDWRPLGFNQNEGEGRWAQPQSREPIRRQRTELGVKKRH